MNNVNITNGTVSIGQTVKTGDFENKKSEVSLSFTVSEGTDADMAVLRVATLAQAHLNKILGLVTKEDTRNDAKPKETVVKETVKAPKPPKPPVTEKTAEAVDEFDSKFEAKEIATSNTKAVESTDEGIDDLLGGGEPAKEITDKELTDATQKCQSANHNAPAIRKVLKDILKESGIVTPPGRIIDIPQAKRQFYIDELQKVKPLA